MARTVGELVADVNNLVDENFVASMIVGWFNEALGDLAEVARMESVSRTFTTAGVDSYALPPDHYKTMWVFIAGVKIPPVDIDSEDVGYHEWGGVLTIVPPPPLDNDELELYYYRLPATLSPSNLNASPDIPERYYHLLTLFAAARTQSRDEDLEEKNDFWRDYIIGKQSYNRDTASKVAKHRSLTMRVG